MNLDVPESLPIAARAEEIIDAIRANQVVIIAGETGSGKSTQLPKLCVAAGKATAAMIGHTQPRRIAARTIAERIADETGVQLGDEVGFAVRFTDKVGPTTRIKVMTDGILLAEIQRDRLLRRYDTLIIDEAHERSLNIDFLLGYIKQLLPKRPDLTVIVTSATIDTQRFSEHFDGAPVLVVEGRSYPVDIRYRPPQDGTEPDPVQMISDAVDEICTLGKGDVLVFVSGEREIHDTADAIRERHLPNTEVLPLYARLSSVEQQRIFQPHRGRRIVLSTNVAETSLTVPGIRYVIDAGQARISRYSHRLKVQRLPIEPISQASANQRAGRCGRVAAGVCIRLYSEADFTARDEFTEPEILRTNLASVILQMTALGLGDVGAFPFVEAPDPKSIRDGHLLLDELGALSGASRASGASGASWRGQPTLTAAGKAMARLPIDPRMARMVIEAQRHGCVREVMVIAAALSIQDPRERPADQRQQADECHRRFSEGTSGSDFIALVKLWDYLRERQQHVSGNQFRKLCRQEYLNYLRVREWHDLYSQLRQIAGQLNIRPGTDSSHPDRIHQALMAGLLSHLGMRNGTTRDYKGAHGSTFALGHGSGLAKKLPKWVMAAELVETNRLWGRTLAAVQPEWAEKLAGDLAKYSYGEPRWESRSARSVTTERVSLYGLPIVSGRAIGYDRVDRRAARELFIRHALVERDWATHHSFVDHNTTVLDELRAMEDRTRNIGTITDDTIFAFYDQRVGDDVVSGRHFDSWWKRVSGSRPDLLTMTPEALGQAAANDMYAYPSEWIQGDVTLPLTYRFDPGATDDGVTVHIPLAVLNRVDPFGFDWNVPGFREDVVGALFGALPKEARRQLIPMTDSVRAVLRLLQQADRDELRSTNIGEALSRAVREACSVTVRPQDFDVSRLDPHLRLTFAVHDVGNVDVDVRQATPLARAKSIPELKRLVRSQMRAAIAAATDVDERHSITTWDLGDLPQRVDTPRGSTMVYGYPALVDDGDSVSLRTFTNADVQQRVMRGGVRRLLLLAVPLTTRQVAHNIGKQLAMTVAASDVYSLTDLCADAIVAAADAIVVRHGLVWNQADFDHLVGIGRAELSTTALAACRHAAHIIERADRVRSRLAVLTAPSVAHNVSDVRDHLERLVPPRFVAAHGAARLADVNRYIEGIERRLDKVTEDPAKDAHKLADVRSLERAYGQLLARLGDRVGSDVVELGWSLEELRVSVFAQSLGTARPVSVKRISGSIARAVGSLEKL